jgi:hypothetical protein
MVGGVAQGLKYMNDKNLTSPAAIKSNTNHASNGQTDQPGNRATTNHPTILSSLLITYEFGCPCDENFRGNAFASVWQCLFSALWYATLRCPWMCDVCPAALLGVCIFPWLGMTVLTQTQILPLFANFTLSYFAVLLY